MHLASFVSRVNRIITDDDEDKLYVLYSLPFFMIRVYVLCDGYMFWMKNIAHIEHSRSWIFVTPMGNLEGQ
jgi:hypothetical protein